MELLKLMSLWLPNERLTEVAKQVAERSRREVAQLVLGRTAGMSAAEQRGYIRARSAAVIHREADLAIQRHPRLRGSDRTALVQLATQTLVTAVSCEAATRRTRKVA